ncbi:MAG: Bax inhibitor-1/YccA family protein [Cytophagales bacterium]|nr:Bax inhibitor-1/YccA family protein [Cytophagales bacterium]
MTKVYAWMSSALAVTAITAVSTALSGEFFDLIFSNPILKFGIIGAQLFIVFRMGARINRMSFRTAMALFYVYAALNGVIFSSIFYAFRLGTIGSVFFITAGTFGIMSFVGYTTKKDLSGMGSMAMMGLIGIIIASLVNFFLGSAQIDYLISFIGIIVFVALTAWDTQKIKMIAESSFDMETKRKAGLIGALSLYLDFINLFLFLLRFLGRRD